MKKAILKMLMPSADTLANWAAQGLQKAVNESDRAEALAKWTGYAGKAGEIQAVVAKWLRDGKVDDQERDELRKAVLPLFEKLMELL